MIALIVLRITITHAKLISFTNWYVVLYTLLETTLGVEYLINSWLTIINCCYFGKNIKAMGFGSDKDPVICIICKILLYLLFCM